MLKRSRKKKDLNESAYDLVQKVTSQNLSVKNPAAVALGRLGGKKGGPARAQKLSPKRRTAIAKKAAKSRWTKKA